MSVKTSMKMGMRMRDEVPHAEEYDRVMTRLYIYTCAELDVQEAKRDGDQAALAAAENNFTAVKVALGVSP